MVKFSYGNSCFKMEIKGEYINKKDSVKFGMKK